MSKKSYLDSSSAPNRKHRRLLTVSLGKTALVNYIQSQFVIFIAVGAKHFKIHLAMVREATQTPRYTFPSSPPWSFSYHSLLTCWLLSTEGTLVKGQGVNLTEKTVSQPRNAISTLHCVNDKVILDNNDVGKLGKVLPQNSLAPHQSFGAPTQHSALTTCPCIVFAPSLLSVV
jgi:hypothetical protein